MDWKWEATKQVLAAFIRWLLASLATFLVTRGIVDPEMANSFLNEATGIIVGALIFLALLGWKWANARFHILALIKAVQTDPPADTPAEVAQAVADVKAQVSASPSITAQY